MSRVIIHANGTEALRMREGCFTEPLPRIDTGDLVKVLESAQSIGPDREYVYYPERPCK